MFKKMKKYAGKIILLAISAAVSTFAAAAQQASDNAPVAEPPLGANPIEAMKNYEPGNSLAWFFELKVDSQKKAKSKNIAKKILGALSSGNIGDEAFRLACVLLKPIAPADSETTGAMRKFLLDEKRVSPACDVLIALSTSDADEALSDALKEALKSKNYLCAMNIVSTIAARGEDIDSVAEVANSENEKLACFAVVALGRFCSGSALEVLEAIAGKKDFRRKSAIFAINTIASNAFMSGDVRLARRAVALVPENCPLSVFVRAATIEKDNANYLDSLIAKGGALSQSAARARNIGRTFENSGELIEKFPKLERDAKLAAMGSFMITGDTRFYHTIAPEIDSADSDIRALAIYSARFICTDEANLKKIYKIFSDKLDCWQLARNVLVENPSFAMKKVLQEAADSGDLSALEILVERGDIPARKKLLSMFLDSNTRNSKISQAVENTVRYSELKELAKNFKRADADLSKEIAKLIIKKLAKTKDKDFNSRAAKEIISDSLEDGDPLKKFIYEKLSIK